MSASRDRNHKIQFISENLYRIYKEGEKNKPESHRVGALTSPILRVDVPPKGLPASATEKTNSRIIKSGDYVLRDSRDSSAHKIIEEPRHVIESDPALKSLKENLDRLNELHSRLKFMLSELDDLVTEEK